MRVPSVPGVGKFEQAEIEPAVRRGLFVPFLGAGASSLRPKRVQGESPPWDRGTQRIPKIWPNLTPEGKCFLRSVADAHNLHVSFRARKKRHDDDPLAELQVALVKAGVCLTKLFGQAMGDSCGCVCGLENYRVPLPGSVPTQLKECLGEMLACAEKIQRSSDREKLKPLEVDNVCNRLRDFANQFLSRKAVLRLADLQWIADLLWYTIRYPVPAYPTTAELTFLLNLGLSWAPFVRGELAPNAEAYHQEWKDLVRRIRTWFEFYERETEHNEPTKFAKSIAKALRQAYQCYRDPREPLRDFNLLPIAVTTNFDRVLEKALKTCVQGFHVVFPVHLDGNPETRPTWLISTEYDGQRIKLQLAGSAVEDPENPPPIQKYLGQEISGPILVKLHGSPLENLTAAYNVVTRGASGYPEHCLVLSESSYLRTMVRPPDPMPLWIEQQLKFGHPYEGRSLWFLGYSIADWDMRLRMYEHLHHSDEARSGADASSGPIAKRAVNRRFERFRSSLLVHLGIVTYEMELETIADAIDRAIP